jgi:hypothetical protein
MKVRTYLSETKTICHPLRLKFGKTTLYVSRLLNKYRLDAEIAHDIFIVDIVSADTYLLACNTMWGISTHSRE